MEHRKTGGLMVLGIRLKIAHGGFFFDQLMLLYLGHISGEDLPILTLSEVSRALWTRSKEGYA